MTADLRPRHEHTLPCGHKAVTDDHHRAICCTHCGRIQEPVEVVKFHINADGYRRGEREVIA